MTGQTYVIFHTAADDSYMNSTANFRGADVGAEFVDLYFVGAQAANDTVSGYDKVRVTCTNGEEDRAIEQVASAMGGVKAGGFVVIADDVNSVYAGENILSCGAITLASQVQTRAFEAITTTKSLEASDSGKVFTVDQGSAYSITLPTVAQAGAGWHATFFLVGQDNNAVEIIPDASEDTLRGSLTSAAGAGASAEAGVDQLIFVANTAKNGERVDIVCTGSCFEVSGFMHDDDHITLA